uniref:tumor necrosis factor receptor superfamily member 9-like n=1 Tax=Monopterus albus TaxID=43700 RepID=UPI0009B42B8F|nr:tumor necrosis factor receptor superfamily member 9-like [Monopterus albus]
MVEFCSEHQKTICSPCKEGYFASEFNMFDRCEKCQSCQHEYGEKCTPTTDATCSCRSGFLCSNSVCSICEENKCVTGEKVKKTEMSSGAGLIKYSYHCEPACPGNKTHDSVCKIHAEKQENGDGSLHVIFGIGFVLSSLILLVFLLYACIKHTRKLRADNNPVLRVLTSTSDFHLSKEESGLHFIVTDECKDSNSFGQLHVG